MACKLKRAETSVKCFNESSNAVQCAWDSIFSKRVKGHVSKEMIAFEDLFPATRSIESFELSDVHKVVLEIYPLKIERMLLKETWRCQIDFTDAWGRTPLHWAVRRNDVAAVENLLWAGANVSPQDRRGCAPVHFAADKPDIACLELLLKYNADATVKDDGGSEAIHRAAYTSVPHVKALVGAGGSLENKNKRGGTPLDSAAITGQVAVGRFLLAMGANKNNIDYIFGNSPLFAAISSHQCEFLEMLLDVDADIQHKNNSGSTLLHWAARWGDVRTIDLLMKRIEHLSKIDVGHRDNAGNTARDVLDNRISMSDGLAEEIKRLISSLEDLNRKSQAVPLQQPHIEKQRLGFPKLTIELPQWFWLLATGFLILGLTYLDLWSFITHRH